MDTDKVIKDAEEAKKNERKPSMVKLPGRDEYLLLPDRESVLKFNANEDFALESDKAGQMEQRDSTWWGRLYVENFPLNFQFFRGHFGTAPPMGTVDLLLADPLNMCEDFNPVLLNKESITSR